ncbi:hypothetical protein [Chelonobacter oris]|uniref:hypothetical protein n=1 Tax=Chelonobacter oris TaxID=505317 RepID=UPI00244B3FEB|nr:hypothetical protein [Chelonobacter oris]
MLENRSYKIEMPGIDKINPIVGDRKEFFNKMKKEDFACKQKVLDRYQELYNQDPELRVIGENSDEDIKLLQDVFLLKKN